MAYIGSTPTSQNFTSGTDYFSGTGSQTAYTLTRTVNSVNDIEVVINNVVQQPSTAYTLSGTTITFTSAPSSGTNNIYVRYLSTTTLTIAPSQGTVSTASIADSNVTTAKIADANITQAKLASGVAGTGPAFYVTPSVAQTIASSTYVKVQFDTESFDTNTNYDTGNYRFTPTVAGYYQVNASVQYGGVSTLTGFIHVTVYKNGSAVGGGNLITALQYAIPAYSTLVYMNGSTDYLEVYTQHSQGTSQSVAGSSFSGFLVRAA